MLVDLIDVFKCYVRPIHEYVSVVWSSHHICLINRIENVQRNFTKPSPGLYCINYNDKLFL